MKKRYSGAADRNRGPIADVLARELPGEGTVLEIASGSGQHAAFFADRFSQLAWQPSDPSPEARASIEAYRAEVGLPNLLAPVEVDVLSGGWEAPFRENVSAMLCINMIHIAPWEATLGLFQGAGRILGAGKPLVLYGPYRFGGVFLADSNAEFSRTLAGMNPAFGVRDLDDVTREAQRAGFDRGEPIALPAENHVIVFRRRAALP